MKDLEKIKQILINVDMVNGFVNEGAMHDKYIRHTIPIQIKLMEEFEENEERLNIIIKDTHKENCREFNRYPVHCVENTEESELVDELKSFENENSIVFKKNSTSAIYAEGFVDTINALKNLEKVVIVGCCTDICVLNLAIPLQNYFDQIDRDIKITIPKDAVETYDAPSHSREEYNQMAFKLMHQAGIEII
ncbi:MAG: cysteine hydrolase [Clostridia bacterium]|nr:cysteine hydrolase [Clostridia bacterium]